MVEYEAEVERMSLVLETQKTSMSDLEQSVKKSKDDMTREIQKKVCKSVSSPGLVCEHASGGRS